MRDLLAAIGLFTVCCWVFGLVVVLRICYVAKRAQAPYRDEHQGA